MRVGCIDGDGWYIHLFCLGKTAQDPWIRVDKNGPKLEDN